MNDPDCLTPDERLRLLSLDVDGLDLEDGLGELEAGMLALIDQADKLEADYRWGEADEERAFIARMLPVLRKAAAEAEGSA